MAVHIRLARAGTSKVPFYRIVAADHRKARGGRFIERLGTWDPRRKEIVINQPRVAHWIDRGAQPSLVVSRLIKQSAAAAEKAGS
jgi:small subunit ribosomal protein S16